MNRNTTYTLLACAVLALSVIPVGGAVFLLGFVHGDSPCVMCWQQRTGMAIVALIGLFVLRYGPRPRYMGLALLVGAWGLHMAVRHSALHVARDIGQGFSVEVLGAHTYTWSAFIFWLCVVAMGVLMLMLKDGDTAAAPRALRPLEKMTMWVFLVVIAGNILQAFASTGPPPFMGQGDPVRFSFNPRHWVWSLEEWSPAPVSLRARWAAAKPGAGYVSADPAACPLANLPSLSVKREIRLSLPLRGTVTDIAFDPATERFLLTTQQGVYIADGSLTRVLRHTVVDAGYSVDLGRFAGAAFLEGNTVMALGENKSFVILRENDEADAGRNYRFFLESFDRFDEVARARLATVRAKMMYVMSLAFDSESVSLYTVTVPNARTSRLVVSRFDRRDLTLSEEYLPALAPESGLVFRDPKRTLDEFFVTGATIAGGRMYAISAAFGTLLTVDLGKRAVVGAHLISGLDRPAGIACRGTELYVVTERGTVFVVDRP